MFRLRRFCILIGYKWGTGMAIARLHSIASVIFALSLFFIISCGQFKKNSDLGSAPSGASAPAASSCGPKHAMVGYTVAWQKSQCVQADSYYVDQSSVGDDGKILGSRDASAGMLSVKYIGVVNGDIYPAATFAVYFQAWGNEMASNATGAQQRGPVYWEFVANRGYRNYITSRLVTDRYDGSCLPYPYCHDEDYHADRLQFTDSSDTAQFDCSWSLTAYDPGGKIWCVVTKQKSGETHTYWVTMKGPYAALQYIGVGKSANPLPWYRNVNAQVSDFKVTVFSK